MLLGRPRIQSIGRVHGSKNLREGFGVAYIGEGGGGDEFLFRVAYAEGTMARVFEFVIGGRGKDGEADLLLNPQLGIEFYRGSVSLSGGCSDGVVSWFSIGL